MFNKPKKTIEKDSLNKDIKKEVRSVAKVGGEKLVLNIEVPLKDVDSLAIKEKEQKKEQKKKEGIKLSKEYIINQLKANIGRDLFDINTYFIISSEIDVVYKKAIESINDKTFKKMKIAN